MNANLIWMTTDITPSRFGMSAGTLPCAASRGHRGQVAVLAGAAKRVPFAGLPAWSPSSC